MNEIIDGIGFADKPQTGACFVYILRCADSSLYTGWTTNVDKRLEQHNQGKAAKYTRSRLPVELVYTEACDTKSAALKREKAIKALPRSGKLSLIEPD